MKRSEKLLRTIRFRRFSAVQLLISLALLFISVPFIDEIKGGRLIVTCLLALIVLSAVLAIGDRKSVLVIALMLAIPAVVGRWINYFRPNLVHPAVFLVCGLLVMGLVIARLLRFVLRAPSVNTEVLCASIAAYVMLGVMWTMAYWLVDQLTPGGAFSFSANSARRSMNGFTALYFSFTTLSTVGYGDITPVSNIACWLAAMEAMTGLLYVAVLIARLVAIYSSPKSHPSETTKI